MTMFRNDGWIKSTLGTAVVGAQVYVCLQPATTSGVPPSPLATLFADSAGVTPLSQPVTTDGFGHYDFYVAPGFYTVVIVFSGTVQQVYKDQAIGITGSALSSITLEVNGVPASSQTLQNLTQGSGVTLQDQGNGVIAIGATDGTIHGDTIWQSDSSYMILRDDFLPYFPGPGATSSWGIGQLGWGTYGATLNPRNRGGYPPHLGIFMWSGSPNANTTAVLSIPEGSGSNANWSNVAMALLENPGWKVTWVWQHAPTIGSGGNSFSLSRKNFYIGLMGPVLQTASMTLNGGRPDVFVGLRFDTSNTPGSFALSSAGNASSGNTTYNGTMPGCTSTNSLIGQSFVVSGFNTPANNGTFLCTSNTTTSITLNNANGVSEVHAATCAGSTGLQDTTFKFEAVENFTYSNGGRRNIPGTVVDTTVVPVIGAWYRLDMVCTTAGQVTLTLNGVHSTTLTMNKMVVSGWNSASYYTHNFMTELDFGTGPAATPYVSSGNTNPYHVFAIGSKLTFAGFANAATALNGNTYQLQTLAINQLEFYTPGFSDAAATSPTMTPGVQTITGYPALLPCVWYGNTETAPPPAADLFIDYFSMIWNPALSGAVVTPDPTKSRYWLE